MSAARQQARDPVVRQREQRGEWLIEAVDEVCGLWPYLPAALPRDSAGPSATGERVSSSSDPAARAVPVNETVAAVLLDVPTAVSALDNRLRTLLGDEPYPRPTADRVRAMVGYYQRLVHLAGLHGPNAPQMAQAADRMVLEVQRWQRECRKAIGLNRPAHPFPSRYRCPHGCVDGDGDRAVLMVLGDRATLATRLATTDRQPVRDRDVDEANRIARSYGDVGRSYLAGDPGYREAWSWRSAETVLCPACGCRWRGDQQLRMLGQLLQPSATSVRVPDDVLVHVMAKHGMTVQRATLRQWRRRGVLADHGRDDQGRALYDVAEAVRLAYTRRTSELREAATDGTDSAT